MTEEQQLNPSRVSPSPSPHSGAKLPSFPLSHQQDSRFHNQEESGSSSNSTGLTSLSGTSIKNQIRASIRFKDCSMVSTGRYNLTSKRRQIEFGHSDRRRIVHKERRKGHIKGIPISPTPKRSIEATLEPPFPAAAGKEPTGSTLSRATSSQPPTSSGSTEMQSSAAISLTMATERASSPTTDKKCAEGSASTLGRQTTPTCNSDIPETLIFSAMRSVSELVRTMVQDHRQRMLRRAVEAVDQMLPTTFEPLSHDEWDADMDTDTNTSTDNDDEGDEDDDTEDLLVPGTQCQDQSTNPSNPASETNAESSPSSPSPGPYFYRQHGSPTSSNSSHALNSTGSAKERRAAPGSHGTNGKRKMKGKAQSGGEEGEEDDEEDDKRKKRDSSKQKMPKGLVEGKKLACPFLKRHPCSPKSQACVWPGFSDTSRLKAHLYKRHCFISKVCGRCDEVFEDEECLQRHQNTEKPCERNEKKVERNGITSDQERQLRSKKRRRGENTEEEKWQGIYRILFPKDTIIPPPYRDNTTPPPNISKDSELASFEEFALNRVRSYAKQHVERTLSSQGSAIEAELQAELVEIIPQALQQIFREWKERRNSTHSETLMVSLEALHDLSRNSTNPAVALPHTVTSASLPSSSAFEFLPTIVATPPGMTIAENPEMPPRIGNFDHQNAAFFNALRREKTENPAVQEPSNSDSCAISQSANQLPWHNRAGQAGLPPANIQNPEYTSNVDLNTSLTMFPRAPTQNPFVSTSSAVAVMVAQMASSGNHGAELQQTCPDVLPASMIHEPPTSFNYSSGYIDPFHYPLQFDNPGPLSGTTQLEFLDQSSVGYIFDNPQTDTSWTGNTYTGGNGTF